MKNAFTLTLIPCLVLMVTALKAAPAVPVPASVLQAETGRKLPFHGRVAAVDVEAQTIQVGKRTFHVSKETRIEKDEKPMPLSEELVGQRVGGSYVKGEDGTLHARLIRVAQPRKSGLTPGAF